MDNRKFHEANSSLAQIFSAVPADCTDVRLGVRVWFGMGGAGDRYALTDVLYYGGGRERVRYAERAEQLEFTQAQLSAASTGWTQGQPVRRNTSEFMYSFTPATAEEFAGYKLHSRSVQATERRRQAALFQKFN